MQDETIKDFTNTMMFATRCSCSSEVLTVEVYDYDEGGKKDSKDYEFDISIFERYHKRSFFDRLRYVWKIMTTGRPYGDQIVLRHDSAKNLGEWLLERCNS